MLELHSRTIDIFRYKTTVDILCFLNYISTFLSVFLDEFLLRFLLVTKSHASTCGRVSRC